MRVDEFVVYSATVLQDLLQYAAPDSEVRRVWRWSRQKLMACAWQVIPTRAVDFAAAAGFRNGPPELGAWAAATTLRAALCSLALWRAGLAPCPAG